MRAFIFILLASIGLQAQSTPESESAKTQIDRVKPLVEAGALPPSRLVEAEMILADARDNQILSRSLFSATTQVTEQEAQTVVDAASRRLDRQKQRVTRLQDLVDQGILARNEVEAAKSELAQRQTTFSLAAQHLELVHHIAELASAEKQLMESKAFEPQSLVERFDGRGRFQTSEFRLLDQAFIREFGVGLPVSAFGQTATHDALGFDHHNRIDIALLPDSKEGQFLIKLLRANQIPFYAMRAAIAGKATAPHIHIGPPSTPLLRGN